MRCTVRGRGVSIMWSSSGQCRGQDNAAREIAVLRACVGPFKWAVGMEHRPTAEEGPVWVDLLFRR